MTNPATKSRPRSSGVRVSAKTVYGVIDLFCGTGGFSHGMEQAHKRFRTVGAIDVLKDAAATCAANSKQAEVLCGDIRKMRPSAMARKLGTKDVAVIVGGPPCQGFSSLRPFREIGRAHV